MTEILRSNGANVSSPIKLTPVGRACVQVSGLGFQSNNATGPLVRLSGRAGPAHAWVDLAILRPGELPLIFVELPPQWQAEIINNIAGAEIAVEVVGLVDLLPAEGISRSVILATANVAQTVAPAATTLRSRRGQNVGSVDIWVSESGAAAIGAPGSFCLPPMASFSCSTSGALSAITGSAGAVLSIVEA